MQRDGMARKQITADKIKWLRGRAEEIRVAGEGMKNPHARVAMLHLAETYGRLANSLDFALERKKRSDVG